VARPQTVSDEAILATMRRHVLAHGPAVSLDLVAEALKISTPAVLKRFGTRRALMISALQPPMPPSWIKSLELPLSKPALRQQLVSVFRSIQSYMAEVMPCMLALSESGISTVELFAGGPSLPEISVKSLTAWFSDAKQRRVIDCEFPSVVATAVLGAFQNRILMFRMKKQVYRPEEHQLFIEQLASTVEKLFEPKQHTRSKKAAGKRIR
jgi:AcrR family transcriptional regulator